MYYVTVQWPSKQQRNELRPYNWRSDRFLGYSKTHWLQPAVLQLSEEPVTMSAIEWVNQFKGLIEDGELARFRPQPTFSLWEVGKADPIRKGVRASEALAFFSKLAGYR